MIYISVAEVAKKWKISERSVRNYCAEGRVAGARLSGKTWEIPNDVEIGTYNFENDAITVKTNKNICKKLKIRKHFKDHKNLLICNE